MRLTFPRRAGRAAALAAIIALAVPAAPASAVVLDVTRMALTHVNATQATETLTSSFINPVALTGQVQVTTLVVGTLADGARDGASIGVPGATLATGSLISGGNPVAVTGAGGAASLNAAGGTSGQVFFYMASASAGVAPADVLIDFGFNSLSPPLGVEAEHRMMLGYSVVDGGTLDGVSLTGNQAFGRVANFDINGVPHVMGFGNSGPGLSVSSTGSSTGSAGCAAIPCFTVSAGMDFTLGARDQVAALLRQEIGGDGPESVFDLLSAYAAVIDTQVFDCGVVGCTGQQIAWSFTLSAGDAVALQILQIVSSVEPVPEPATLALLGAGLAGLGAARRRRSA